MARDHIAWLPAVDVDQRTRITVRSRFHKMLGGEQFETTHNSGSMQKTFSGQLLTRVNVCELCHVQMGALFWFHNFWCSTRKQLMTKMSSSWGNVVTQAETDVQFKSETKTLQACHDHGKMLSSHQPCHQIFNISEQQDITASFTSVSSPASTSLRMDVSKRWPSCWLMC